MKFLVALVLALVCGFTTGQQTQGTAGDFTPIPWDPNNEELVSLMNFGLQDAIPNAIAAGQILEGYWTWTQVNNVEVQVVAGMNYQFSVEISDGAGDIAILTYVVYEDLLGNMSFVSWTVL